MPKIRVGWECAKCGAVTMEYAGERVPRCYNLVGNGPHVERLERCGSTFWRMTRRVVTVERADLESMKRDTECGL